MTLWAAALRALEERIDRQTDKVIAAFERALTHQRLETKLAYEQILKRPRYCSVVVFADRGSFIRLQDPIPLGVHLGFYLRRLEE